MKKLTLILLSFTLFLFACEKDKIDPRDKYVGEYRGVLVPYLYSTAPLEDGQPVEFSLKKYSNIDNALLIEGESHPPIVGSTNFGTGVTGWGDCYINDGVENNKNRIYVSDKEYIYQVGLYTWQFPRLCRFVEPDSLYCVIDIGLNDIFFIKARKDN